MLPPQPHAPTTVVVPGASPRHRRRRAARSEAAPLSFVSSRSAAVGLPCLLLPGRSCTVRRCSAISSSYLLRLLPLTNDISSLCSDSLPPPSSCVVSFDEIRAPPPPLCHPHLAAVVAAPSPIRAAAATSASLQLSFASLLFPLRRRHHRFVPPVRAAAASSTRSASHLPLSNIISFLRLDLPSSRTAMVVRRCPSPLDDALAPSCPRRCCCAFARSALPLPITVAHIWRFLSSKAAFAGSAQIFHSLRHRHRHAATRRPSSPDLASFVVSRAAALLPRSWFCDRYTIYRLHDLN